MARWDIAYSVRTSVTYTNEITGQTWDCGTCPLGTILRDVLMWVDSERNPMDTVYINGKLHARPGRSDMIPVEVWN